MKKSLVALAALAAAGAASAQSSVTLFGVMDAGISYYEVKSAFYNNTGFLVVPPLTVPVGVKKSQTAMSTGALSSTRIGFRGTEDLGGGLSASFWLEAGIANDTGLGNAVGGAFNFNRRSTVSLSGGFGEIRLGRDYTPTFWNNTIFDPFGTVGVGTSLLHSVETNLHTARGPGSVTSASDNYVRSNNSIGYFLPPNLGGFYGQVMYTLHENVKNSGAVDPNPSKRNRYIGGRFGYANGPLDVAASYGESTAVDAAIPAVIPAAGFITDNKIKTFNVAASWDFGVAKLFGEVSRVKDKAEGIVPFALPFGSIGFTDTDKYNGYLLGVTVPVGPGLIRASAARVKYDNGLPTNVATPLFAPNLDASATKFAIGYVHNLSKRTALYATAARIRIKDGFNNPGILGVTTGGSPAYLSSGAGTVGYAPRTATGYDFGIRHSF